MKKLDFGDYCKIEQERYGADNAFYRYKVVGAGQANYYREVPVDSTAPHNAKGEMVDVVKVICCGVVEDKVETFRLSDVTKTPSCDWFGELYSGSQKEIISLTEEHNLGHPREYGSATDILLDIRRVS